MWALLVQKLILAHNTGLGWGTHALECVMLRTTSPQIHPFDETDSALLRAERRDTAKLLIALALLLISSIACMIWLPTN